MSTTINNVSGFSAQIWLGEHTVANLPLGYHGELNLAGTFRVTYGGSVEITTATNRVPTPSITGQCNVSVVGDGGGGGALYVNGAPRYPAAWPVGAVVDYVQGGQNNTIGIVPNFLDATLTINGTYPMITASFSAGSYSTNITTTTNVIGGQDVGQFTTTTMLKAVTLQPSSLVEQSYASESKWVWEGFILGLTIFVFMFILRLVRAIPCQGGDF